MQLCFLHFTCQRSAIRNAVFSRFMCAGFDPLRLGATNKEQLKWYREGELYNGRWAMAAVAGILFTDLVGLPKFWEAGAQVGSILICGRGRHVWGAWGLQMVQSGGEWGQ